MEANLAVPPRLGKRGGAEAAKATADRALGLPERKPSI